jgi:hypothetical protein
MDIVRDFERLRIDEPDYLNIAYYEGRKERNLDLYEITDNNRATDFIARYVGNVNNPDDDENPDVHLRFMIMYKRPSNLRYPNCTYPWINIHTPFFVIKNTATNGLRRVPTDNLEFRNDELPINLIDDDWRDNEIESGEYVIRQTDVLDNNIPVEIFDPIEQRVIMRPVINFNAMDTTGGKRRKSRRRTKRSKSSKRNLKGNKSRKSRRHRK